IDGPWRVFKGRSEFYRPRFFFQAEDGIRDLTVTGVQTCALPIYVSVVARQQIGLDPRRGLLVHEAVAVDAVDGVGAQAPRLDVVLDRVNQVEPFVFEEVRGGGREHQERVARVPVGDNRHLHPKVRAVPRSDATLHTEEPSSGETRDVKESSDWHGDYVRELIPQLPRPAQVHRV